MKLANYGKNTKFCSVTGTLNTVSGMILTGIIITFCVKVFPLIFGISDMIEATGP